MHMFCSSILMIAAHAWLRAHVRSALLGSADMGNTLAKQYVIDKTRKYLSSIGQRVEALVKEKGNSVRSCGSLGLSCGIAGMIACILLPAIVCLD